MIMRTTPAATPTYRGPYPYNNASSSDFLSASPPEPTGEVVVAGEVVANREKGLDSRTKRRRKKIIMM